MEAGVNIFEVLLGIAMTFIAILVGFHLKNSSASHRSMAKEISDARAKFGSEIANLKADVTTLKSNRMTEEKVRLIMHEQLEPITKMLDKIQKNQDSMKDDVIFGIKESVANINANNLVMKQQIDMFKDMLKVNGQGKD